MKHAQDTQADILTATFEKLSFATSLHAITHTVAEAARRLTGADGSTFVLREKDLCYYVDESAISPLWKGNKFPMEACISGWSMIHGQVVTIKDIYKDDRIPHDAYRPTFVKSLCMVPIRPESAIGAIGNYWSKEYIPSENDTKVLQILANSTAVALENLELKKAISTHESKSLEMKEQAKDLEVAMFSMGHDLRTPVGAMAGLAELVRMRLGSNIDPKTAEFLRLIMETGQQASEQIERMLSLYRATNGKLEKRKVNLTEIAREAMSHVQLQTPERTVWSRIHPDMFTFADPRLLRMVMENLLSNAMKFSSRKPDTQIEIGQMPSMEGRLQLPTYFVRDNGEGFDASEVHKLFKPMSRLHKEEEFVGTGLGLSSVAKIIELHGGQVRAEGKKSEGATFYFSLPPVN